MATKSRSAVIATWTRVPSVTSHLFDNVPIHRTKAAVLYSWPFVYVLGGRSGHVVCKDFWRFNVGNDQWEEIFLDEQPLLENHAACFHEGALYVFGGQFSHYAEMAVWREGQRRFTPATAQNGASTTGKPFNVRGHSLVSLGDYIYLFGGWADTTGASNQMWRFDPATCVWKQLKLSKGLKPRHSHSAVTFGSSMWIFGGIRNFDVLGDLWRIEFDKTGNLLRCEEVKCRQAPSARYGHGACVIGQKMFIFGGYSDDGLAMDNFWCFDFVDCSWRNITPDRHPSDPNPILWPQSSAFHRCVAVVPPQHLQDRPTLADYVQAPVINASQSTMVSVPFERGGTTTSSADSGYAPSSCRASNSSSTSSGNPLASRQHQQQQPLQGILRHRPQTAAAVHHSPIDHNHLQPSTAADNHAYSDEEDLGVVQESNHEDDEEDDDSSSFALPGSVIGFYEEDPKHSRHSRPTTAFTMKSCHIEMTPYPMMILPSEVTPVENLIDMTDHLDPPAGPSSSSSDVNAATVQATTSFSNSAMTDHNDQSTSYAVVDMPKVQHQSQWQPHRTPSIYLVGSTSQDSNGYSKNLKVWICELGDVVSDN